MDSFENSLIQRVVQNLLIMHSLPPKIFEEVPYEYVSLNTLKTISTYYSVYVLRDTDDICLSFQEILILYLSRSTVVVLHLIVDLPLILNYAIDEYHYSPKLYVKSAT